METIKTITAKEIDKNDHTHYSRYELSDDNKKILYVKRLLSNDELVYSKVLCGNFVVESIEKDIDSNYRCINFTYNELKNDGIVKFKTDMIGITKDLDKTLNSNGIIVKSSMKKVLSTYLEDLVGSCDNEILKSSRVGFTEDKEKFITSKIFNSKVLSEKVELSEQFKGYFGPYGSIDEYNEMLKKCVYKAPMQLALSLGFSSITASYMKNDIDCGVLLGTLIGNSSSGKTTAFSLISSIFGKSIISSNGGFFRNSFGTVLSITESIGQISGIPFMIDDISASYDPKYMSMENLIYTLEGGESKSHTDKDYAKYDTKKWDGMILLNAERDLLPRTSKKGAFARTIIFKDVNWTNSAEESMIIKSCCSKNYGFYGEKFVKLLFSMDKTEIFNSILSEKSSLEVLMKDKIDELSDRTLTKLAIILYTAKLVREIFTGIIDVDIDGIRNLLIEAEEYNFNSRNVTSYVYNYIVSELHKIKNHESGTKLRVFKSKYLGDTLKIYVTREAFDDFYIKSNLPIKVNDAINILKFKGILIPDSEDSRNTHKITIDGETKRCLEFVL